jgi:hypothetical protein
MIAPSSPSRGLMVAATLLSVAPLLFLSFTVPELITSRRVIWTAERMGEAVWVLEQHLGWALAALNVVFLLILWIPFRGGQRWSLLPLWGYVLAYLLPVHFVPWLGTGWFGGQWRELLGEALSAPGGARLGLMAMLISLGSAAVLVASSVHLLRQRN